MILNAVLAIMKATHSLKQGRAWELTICLAITDCVWYAKSERIALAEVWIQRAQLPERPLK